MKKTMLILKIAIAVAVLTVTQALKAQCFDPNDRGLCHAADSTPTTITYYVNGELCHCSGPAGICTKTGTFTIHSTDSILHDWSCATNGSSYDSCSPYTDSHGCAYTKEKIVLPGITILGGGCFPTLTYINVTGSRTGLNI